MRPMNLIVDLPIAEPELSSETIAPSARLAAFPAWLGAEFHRFHRVARRADLFKRLHVLTMASLAIAAAQGVFALFRAPWGASYVFAASLILGGSALLCLPATFIASRVAEGQRLALVRKFYGINLRLDPEGRLFLNKAHGELILDHPALQG